MTDQPPSPPAVEPLAEPVPDPAAEAGEGGRKQIEKMWVLVALAALAFNPPLMRAFGAPATVLGWPLLYVYIFAIWAVIIVLTARLVDRGADRSGPVSRKEPG